MDLELRKNQICQLDILLKIDRICNENDIDYFLCAGTLLGAIRHNGFIPWDDDLDGGMTRDNYEKFIKIASKILKKQYFLQNWDTDYKFAMPFSKLQLVNSNYLKTV